MSITRLVASNPYNQTVVDVDENTALLNGLINQAKFSKIELDSIYGDVGISRKFNVLSGAGNSTATYTNWSHVTAESGYSIWKIPFTAFVDNSLNEMYLDDKSLVYKGDADQESYTTFSYVFVLTDTYYDRTAEAGTELGTSFSLMSATANYLYVGLGTTFSAIDFDFDIKGANYTLKVEYYNGAWTELSTLSNSLDDNTSNFKTDGRLEFNIPSDWSTTTVNTGINQYWIRISTTTTPVTVAKAYSIFPGNSVYSLLQLNSSNVLNEEWSWCYFSGNVYVTIRNAGNSSYEGKTFISSSSSLTNKQNYFVYNHAYKVSYEQSSYTTGAVFTPRYGFRWFNTGSSINIINWSNTTPFRITNTRSTALAVRIDAGTNDLVTGASTGTGGSVPAQIAKYLAIDIDGTTYKIPCYSS